MDTERTPGRPAAAGRVVALLVGPAAAGTWLHGLRHAPWARLPTDGLSAWVAAAPADVVAACARILALGLCGWVGMTTVAYLAVSVLGSGPARDRLRRMTLPAAREAIDRAVAAGMTGLLAVPGLPTPGAVSPGPLEGPPGIPPVAEAPAEPAGPPHRSGGGERYEVQPGDSLWLIAAARTGSSDPDVIAARWLRIVAATHDQLRSGDPDLIHPGERLVLPPPAPDDQG